MHLIEDLLQEHDFLIKIDLKDAYFGIDKSSRKYISFQYEGNVYEFFCLPGPNLGPAPLIFAKLLKVPIALLTRTNVRITLTFLLQNLDFVINIKRLQLTPVKEIEFLRLVIN